MRSLKEVKLGDIIQYYGDKRGVPYSDPSKFISGYFLLEATVVGIPKLGYESSHTTVFGWIDNYQIFNGLKFNLIGDNIYSFDYYARDWIKDNNLYKALQCFDPCQDKVLNIIPNKSSESNQAIHINNEDYRFFASVQSGFCPCNTIKSECLYHKDQ